MKRTAIAILFCLACLPSLFAQTLDTLISQSSPDKKLVFYFRSNSQSGMEYQVQYQGKEILGWSPLGLALNMALGKTTIGRIVRSAVNETFPWLFGENSTIQNNYRQLTIQCKQDNGFVFDLTARVFNNNIGFRYELPLQKDKSAFQIVGENTGFNFTGPYTVYRHASESVISPTPINELKTNSDFPVVLASPDLFISINEAANDQYTKAVVGKTGKENSLVVKFNWDTVKVNGAFRSPWRTLSFSNTAIGLCDYSDLLYKLNARPDPSRNYSWIKPGKLIRDVTLTTQGALDCIDFAAKMDFQYIMFDAGWYGKGYAAEHDLSSDPHNVVSNIDMPKVISHGKEKNVGLILYVNYVGLRKHNLDTLFSLYKSWGVKGMKFGFVNGLTRDGITWLIQAVKKAQDYGFIINVHDNYKPTGISRTLPAFLTQEGVRGNENNPDAFHNTTLPFTRFLSGAADYTFCYRNQNDSFNNTLLSKKLQVSKVQQLALTVIFYSPLQSMLWYGKPADYQLPEEIEFFKYVPTTWDKTIHLAGEIGRYITVARKKNNTWFIGTAVSDQLYSTSLDLNFLDKGRTYTAVIYEDNGRGGVNKTIKQVSSQSKLTVNIAAKGGQAIMLKRN
jgi:alpha-glucosidase